MTLQVRHVFINLDLDADLYSRVKGLLLEKKVFPGEGTDLDGVSSFGAFSESEGIELIALYSRRADSTPAALAKAVSGIEAAVRLLEQIQIKHAVQKLTLVDCGEVPSAPLSDFTVVAHYLEMISGDLGANAAGRVLALDYDFETDVPFMKVFDTTSTEFLDHFVAYTKDSLQILNKGFGSGPLPD